MPGAVIVAGDWHLWRECICQNSCCVMPFFSDPAVKAARRDTSAVKQRPSACSGQSLLAVLPSVLMASHMWWMCRCGVVCLMVLFCDALEKRQAMVHGLVCQPPGIGAWLASGLDSSWILWCPLPPVLRGVLYGRATSRVAVPGAWPHRALTGHSQGFAS